jgi:hypothetical protein
MRSNETTVTYPRGSTDIKAELSCLKTLQGINASAVCGLKRVSKRQPETSRRPDEEDLSHSTDRRRTEEAGAGPHKRFNQRDIQSNFLSVPQEYWVCLR